MRTVLHAAASLQTSLRCGAWLAHAFRLARLVPPALAAEVRLVSGEVLAKVGKANRTI